MAMLGSQRPLYRPTPRWSGEMAAKLAAKRTVPELGPKRPLLHPTPHWSGEATQADQWRSPTGEGWPVAQECVAQAGHGVVVGKHPLLTREGGG